MVFKELLFGIWTVTVLASCSATDEVASKSPLIQKRRFRSGWHVNLRTGDGHNTAQAPRRSERRAPHVIMPGPMLQHEPLVAPAAGKAIADPDDLTLCSATPAMGKQPRSDLVASANGQALIINANASLDRSGMPEESAINILGVKEDANNRINGFALAGFIFAFLFPLLGFILSVVGLIMISRHGGRGRGFAIVGLVISILLLLFAINYANTIWFTLIPF